MIQAQKELASRVGKPKRDVQLLHVNQEMVDIAREVAGDRLEQALRTEGKSARAKAINTLRDEAKTAILQKFPEADSFAISQAFEFVEKKMFRANILEKQQRVDGRGYQDLRQITCEVGVMPRTHVGSRRSKRSVTRSLVTNHPACLSSRVAQRETRKCRPTV